jgi:hypothetical protein
MNVSMRACVSLCLCVCAHVCVRVRMQNRMRDKEETDSYTERQREKKRGGWDEALAMHGWFNNVVGYIPTRTENSVPDHKWALH